MKTIKCIFKSKGQTIKKTVIISDNFLRLSNSKLNEASEIVDEIWNDYKTWGIIIKDTYCDYELHFKIKDDERTLIPDRAVTWISEERDIIEDVQKLYIK